MINDLLPLLLFSAASSFTPGPNNLMIMNSGMHFGMKKSMPHYSGICLGFSLMVLLVALGLGIVFTRYLWLKQLLKILGSLYMLYLAWQILRSNTKPKSVETHKPLTFLQAVLFQWVNPKAWLMAISTISIFTITNNHYYNALMISFIYFLMCIPCTGAWLLFGNVLNRILKKESHRVWFNIAMALALVGSIAMIIMD